MDSFGRGSAAFLFAILVGAATPASATATLVCSGVDDRDVHIDLTIGSVPVLAIVNANIDTPTGSYAMLPQANQTEIIVGQGMSTPDGLSVDFADSNLMDIVVTLRTMQAYRDTYTAHVGLLTIEDHSVFAVACES